MKEKYGKMVNFWLVEVPEIDVCTQGYTRKEALMMIEDAILTLMQDNEKNDLETQVIDYKDNIVSIQTTKDILIERRRHKENEITAGSLCL